MNKLLLQTAFLLLALASIPANLAAKDQPGFVGDWTGRWSNASGYVYAAEMQLTAASDGGILGKIRWTLKQSPHEADQAKLGTSGTEFVSGTYDPTSRVLTFEGRSKTDPENILGLDKYKLLLAENDDVLGGITWNNGSWLGLFALTRTESD